MNLCEFLEREGGHIATLLFVFLFCMAILATNPENKLAEKAGDMALGALLLAMKGVGNQRQQSGLTPGDFSKSESIPAAGVKAAQAEQAIKQIPQQ